MMFTTPCLFKSLPTNIFPIKHDVEDLREMQSLSGRFMVTFWEGIWLGKCVASIGVGEKETNQEKEKRMGNEWSVWGEEE